MPEWVQDELPFDPPLPKRTEKSADYPAMLQRRLRWLESEAASVRMALSRLGSHK